MSILCIIIFDRAKVKRSRTWKPLDRANYLLKRAQYHVLITEFVLRMKDLNVPEIGRLYSLALGRKYSELG